MNLFDVTCCTKWNRVFVFGAKDYDAGTLVETLTTNRGLERGHIISPHHHQHFLGNGYEWHDSDLESIEGMFFNIRLRTAAVPPELRYETCIVIDEPEYKNYFQVSGSFRGLIMNNRWLNVSMIHVMSHVYPYACNYRYGVDYAFVFGESLSEEEKRRLYTQYAAPFGSYEEMDSFLNECTRMNGCMVIDYNAKTIADGSLMLQL